MGNIVKINREHEFRLRYFNPMEFNMNSTLVLLTDDLKEVKNIFKDIELMEIFRDDTLISTFTCYDTFSDISYTGTQYSEDYNSFVDTLQVSLSKKNLIEQVNEMYKEMHPVDDIDSMSMSQLIAWKKEKLNNACTEDIYSGVQIEMMNGEMNSFSLTPEDQRNISSLASLILQDMTIEALPYHQDGGACHMIDAASLLKLYMEMQMKITYNTTLCNMLKLQLETEEDRDVIVGYSFDYNVLKDTYKEQMDEIIASSLAIMQKLKEKFFGAEVAE